ncbi:thermolabile hemolysin [Vibrio azureus]|uniref:Thermolabile hemolysin n=1 Tax=Vibrio azureus NBRC 104587 TaxID=1219077 RepID=U3CAS7_9VIBR|nr:SGNH/GDSL hydrolase family protein [Vibrio azureus]AUI85418.1 thermolabile hemolysin [Vibrio azureus]GAD75493.1 hypothetical protein VAZ01S_025_00890 [Vibrio azureus NBRC 104587]
MKNTVALLGLLSIPFGSIYANEHPVVEFADPDMYMDSFSPTEHHIQRQKTLNVRCWYRLDHSTEYVSTDWEWAMNPDGSYFTIEGYWRSNIALKNMFYTETSQALIAQRCEDTLDLANENANISFFASKPYWSYNYTIWTNDSILASDKINKIISFGDSLSDTGNVFHASNKAFPNQNSWYLGRFSNGLVWTEYLAKAKDLPVYNWAVGGAGGENAYVFLTGIVEQVASYLAYMKKAENYQAKSTLFTLLFGVNDFMKYERSASDVKSDFAEAMIKLTDAGAENFLLLTLPDVTLAPKFHNASQEQIEEVRANILEMNAFIQLQADYYREQGVSVTVYDSFALFESLVTRPEQHGFVDAAESCQYYYEASFSHYLYQHDLRDECIYSGSDKYVFWDMLHPTTAVHRYVAEQILTNTELDRNHPF